MKQKLYNCPDLSDLPVSFLYNGIRYTGFPSETFKITDRRSMTGRNSETTVTTLRFADSIVITVKQTEYPAYGVSECAVWFENTGSGNSGVISDIHTRLEFTGEKPVLRGILGDHVNQYRPYETDIESQPVHFVSETGRATHIYFPYFNFEYGDRGIMLAIGWAGTWTADFNCIDGKTVYTACAVNNLASYLKTGEVIRSALFVCVPYDVRDEKTAVNLWRRWFTECNMPRADREGNPMKPFSTCCLASDTGLPNSDGSISERHTTWRPSLEKMIAENCKVDFRWFDAGWYSAPNGDYVESDWWGKVGSWELCRIKWPGRTFCDSTDFAREHGMKTLMWFEPERVTDPDSLAARYGYNTDWAIKIEGSAAITNNIGNPDCFAWTVDRICKVLRENQVEMYREDNNSDPALLWKHLDKAEGENRQGITECKMIDGHYRMWDAIISCTLSYGGCGFVDSCASGGGRNDIESMRRGVPLLRSDSDRESTALRLSMTTAFNKWIPFCGAITKEKAWQLDAKGRSDVYTWRASYLPVLNVDSQFVQDPGQDFSVLRAGLEEWKKLNRYLLKDFYILTPWRNKDQKDGFTAYSFYDPDEEKGFILLFRMEQCENEFLKIKIPYVRSGCMYTLTDEDSRETFAISAEELIVTFKLIEKRSARLVWIEKASK